MSTYPATEAGLAAALTDLGDTANHVADTLQAGGYRGEPGCNTGCPLALRLADQFPGWEVSVWADRHGLLYAELHNGTRTVEVLLPAAVAAFVTEFDGGTKYAALIAIGGLGAVAA